MKINQITLGRCNKSQQLRCIFGGYNPLIESAYCKTPISYLFIESVVDAGVIKESDFLASLLSTGLSKLRAALTADSINDLQILLDFNKSILGSEQGDAQQVLNLIDQANNSDTDISNNSEWWDSIFQATGVTDPDIRQKILSQLQVSSTSTPQQSAQPAQPKQEESTPQSPQQSRPTDQTRSPFRSRMSQARSQPNDINQQRQQEQSYNDYLTQQLEQLRQGREANRAEIEKLLQAIQKKKDEASTESICNAISSVLLEHEQVINNIGYISKLLANKICYSYRHPLITITEAGILDRLKGAFRSAGNLAANPALLKTANIKSNNQRIAKLAVQLITSHLRDRLNSTLQKSDMLPKDIFSDYQKFTQILQQIRSGNKDPQLIEQYNQLLNKFKQISPLFNASEQQPQTGVESPAAPQVNTNDQTSNSDSLSVAGPSGVESDTASTQSAEMQQQQQQPESPFTQQQKEAGKQLIIRMVQAGQQAGKAVAGDDKVKVFNAAKEAGKKVAAKYARVDRQVAEAAYKYYVNMLKEFYRKSVYATSESIINDLGRMIID